MKERKTFFPTNSNLKRLKICDKLNANIWQRLLGINTTFLHWIKKIFIKNIEIKN